MAKLYAELTSDKGGRVASKGGNDKIRVILSQKNYSEYVIEYTEKQLFVYDNDGNLLTSTGVPF